jgi:hypothetical protein
MRKGERGKGRIEKGREEVCVKTVFDDTSVTRRKGSLASIDTNNK